ncbi:MAG: hypothetical protein V2I36_11840 [Desulfopila sp.]|jgi:hypothetical protein|nr:hypothetical protein [Desulfopila sp.]
MLFVIAMLCAPGTAPSNQIKKMNIDGDGSFGCVDTINDGEE